MLKTKKQPKEKKIPVYFTVNKEIHDYLDNEVLKTGLSLSAVITVAIQREREQKNALETLADVVGKLDEKKKK